MSLLRHCPALLLAAPSSGQGKTTVTAALARYHRQQGRRVRVFKAGPDFLDPMIHEQASGAPVHSIDLWITGEADARRRLYQAAGEADLILLEGVMGLFDGQPSSADIACTLGIPVLLCIRGAAMAQTFAAIAHGLATYRPGLPVAGVFANQVSGERHYALLQEGLAPGLTAFGYLPDRPDFALPSRHLGLVQASEVADLETRLDHAAAQLQWTQPALPPPVAFAPVADSPPPPLLAGQHIAVARDAAFAFIYPANLETLEQLGAHLHFFSPVAGEGLPPSVDAVYLPGGYPELHLSALAANQQLKADLTGHVQAGRPVLAECGGMLYLLEYLSDLAGHTAPLAGILPGEARMQKRLAGLGPQALSLPEGTLRGHRFHYSTMHTPLTPWAQTVCPNGRPHREAVYRTGRVTASYVHWYFPSSPQAVAALLGA